ncbi:protein phosphatase 2C domain-containing protein [Spiroplasma endosymbiont of Tipula paludosa]|uniref:protein phosphatase 2C domain-containing protein n=1 Tax=Spiroplasma endosymbiont of Tipula paludosa TaxID=3066295 RepID=UPI0035C8FBCE
MKVSFHFNSDIGQFRANNQDAVQFVKNEYGQYFGIVCDGLGGHNGGETASWMAVNLYVSLFVKTDFSNFGDYEINNWLRQATIFVQESMVNYVKEYPQLTDMGTTVSLILITNNKAYLLNIGDSRIYEFYQQNFQQLTTDHNVLNMLHNNKTNANIEKTLWKALTSALGPNKKLQIDTFLVSNIKGITFMLTTDGLHDYLENYEMIDILQSNNKLSQKAKSLVDLALDNVSTDNLTILIVEIK